MAQQCKLVDGFKETIATAMSIPQPPQNPIPYKNPNPMNLEHSKII